MLTIFKFPESIADPMWSAGRVFETPDLASLLFSTFCRIFGCKMHRFALLLFLFSHVLLAA